MAHVYPAQKHALISFCGPTGSQSALAGTIAYAVIPATGTCWQCTRTPVRPTLTSPSILNYFPTGFRICWYRANSILSVDQLGCFSLLAVRTAVFSSSRSPAAVCLIHWAAGQRGGGELVHS
eukprot:2343624-Rhodomonas_salina.1